MSRNPLCVDCVEYATCIRRMDKAKIATCPILTEDEEPLRYRNHEGYPDPTTFFALLNVIREEKRKKQREKRRPRTQVIHYD